VAEHQVEYLGPSGLPKGQQGLRGTVSAKLFPPTGDARKGSIWSVAMVSTHPFELTKHAVAVPPLAIFSFALAVCTGLLVLKSSCSVPELGAIELFAGIAVFLIYELLALNIILTLENFQKS